MNSNQKSSNMGLTSWKSAFQLFNIYVGIGLFSKPYAVASGGWISLGSLLVMVGIFYFSAQNLLWTIQSDSDIESGYLTLNGDTDTKTKTKTKTDTINDSNFYTLDYLAERYGGYYLSLLSKLGNIVEFAGGTCMSIIIIWTILIEIFDQNRVVLVIISTMVVLLTLFLDIRRGLTYLATIGVLSTFITTITMIFLALATSDNRHMTDHTTTVRGFGLSIGIFIISLGGLPNIPNVYSYMNTSAKNNIHAIITACFILITIVYTVVAVCGYYLYGSDTRVIVTSNISNITIYYILSLMLIINSWTTVAQLVDVLAKIVAIDTLSQLTIRLLVFSILVVISYLARNHLQNVESIAGALGTIVTSLIVPNVIYLNSEPPVLEFKYRILATKIILVFAVCTVGFVLYSNI